MPTPLATLLREKIRAHGPLTVEDYVTACLYHPEFGYYSNGHNFLPAPSQNPGTPYPHDFTTAPELTPLFGATLANWVAKAHTTIGAPHPFTLMECGPGRGTLMLAMLTHLQGAHPAVYAAARPLLVETSPTLTNLQKTTLTAFTHCEWATQPTSHLPIILVANELLDAFPHNQLIEHDSRLQPRTISLNEANEFTFHQTGPSAGRITEISPEMRHWLQALPHTLHAALFLDYGAATIQATGDTLQAVHRHQKVSVFHLPGETDLTHHVNFTNVTAALEDSHPEILASPLQPLATFLIDHGLASLALEIQSANPSHTTMDTTLHRLLHPSQMGTLFQVQEFIQPCSTPTRP